MCVCVCVCDGRRKRGRYGRERERCLWAFVSPNAHLENKLFIEFLLHSRGHTKHRRSDRDRLTVSTLKELPGREERRPGTTGLLAGDIPPF